MIRRRFHRPRAGRKKEARIYGTTYLSSSDDTVVVAALEALSQIKDEDSVNSIAHMIDNPDAKIRMEAAKALGSIGTEYAKTYLLHRLNAEQDETVKTAIKDALHTLAEHH